jgi:RimJ/RimL family protein N-acetyltransferase
VEVEVAYLLAREHQGRGLAREAAGAIAGHGFATLAVPRLIALIDGGNTASLRVAAGLGMQEAGTVEVDGDVFPLHAVDRDGWDADRGRP